MRGVNGKWIDRAKEINGIWRSELLLRRAFAQSSPADGTDGRIDQAARLSLTTGRFLWPSRYVTTSARRTPG